MASELKPIPNKAKPIKPSEVFKAVRNKYEVVSDKMINTINGYLKKKKFSFNNALHLEYTFNEEEFNYLVREYGKAGWIVTKKPDNYQTETYYFKPKDYYD